MRMPNSPSPILPSPLSTRAMHARGWGYPARCPCRSPWRPTLHPPLMMVPGTAQATIICAALLFPGKHKTHYGIMHARKHRDGHLRVGPVSSSAVIRESDIPAGATADDGKCTLCPVGTIQTRAFPHTVRACMPCPGERGRNTTSACAACAAGRYKGQTSYSYVFYASDRLAQSTSSAAETSRMQAHLTVKTALRVVSAAAGTVRRARWALTLQSTELHQSACHALRGSLRLRQDQRCATLATGGRLQTEYSVAQAVRPAWQVRLQS